MWGLGVTLYTMVCGTQPFKTIEELSNSRVEFHNGAHLSSDFKALVTSMLARDPERRPNIDELLKNAWLDQFYDRD